MDRNSVQDRPAADAPADRVDRDARPAPPAPAAPSDAGLARSFTRKGELLSRKLSRLAEEVWAPDQSKNLRPFQTQEVAGLLGVTERYVRQMASELEIPKAEAKPAGRRVWRST